MNRIQWDKYDLLLGVDGSKPPVRFHVRKAHGKKTRKLRKLPRYDKGVTRG